MLWRSLVKWKTAYTNQFNSIIQLKNEINWQQTQINFTYLYTLCQNIYNQGNLTPICYMEQSQIMHKPALIMHNHIYLLLKEN